MATEWCYPSSGICSTGASHFFKEWSRALSDFTITASLSQHPVSRELIQERVDVTSMLKLKQIQTHTQSVPITLGQAVHSPLKLCHRGAKNSFTRPGSAQFCSQVVTIPTWDIPFSSPCSQHCFYNFTQLPITKMRILKMLLSNLETELSMLTKQVKYRQQNKRPEGASFPISISSVPAAHFALDPHRPTAKGKLVV